MEQHIDKVPVRKSSVFVEGHSTARGRLEGKYGKLGGVLCPTFGHIPIKSLSKVSDFKKKLSAQTPYATDEIKKSRAKRLGASMNEGLAKAQERRHLAKIRAELTKERVAQEVVPEYPPVAPVDPPLAVSPTNGRTPKSCFVNGFAMGTALDRAREIRRNELMIDDREVRMITYV